MVSQFESTPGLKTQPMFFVSFIEILDVGIMGIDETSYTEPIYFRMIKSIQ